MRPDLRLMRHVAVGTLLNLTAIAGSGVGVPAAVGALEAAAPPLGSRPAAAARLPHGTEHLLRWGKPSNGLRAALVILRPAGEPEEAGEIPELYLAVQNISDAPVRFKDTVTSPRLRELIIKAGGKTQGIIVDPHPTRTEVVLQPREAAVLRFFSGKAKAPGGRTAGSLMAEDMLKDPEQTLAAEMRIEDGPAGTWTGKLRTGETGGTAAAEAGARAFPPSSRPDR
ncbi:MAG: hypothetical protein U0790_01325 [Isosphaeraceae bacterium]